MEVETSKRAVWWMLEVESLNWKGVTQTFFLLAELHLCAAVTPVVKADTGPLYITGILHMQTFVDCSGFYYYWKKKDFKHTTTNDNCADLKINKKKNKKQTLERCKCMYCYFCSTFSQHTATRVSRVLTLKTFPSTLCHIAVDFRHVGQAAT